MENWREPAAHIPTRSQANYQELQRKATVRKKKIKKNKNKIKFNNNKEKNPRPSTGPRPAALPNKEFERIWTSGKNWGWVLRPSESHCLDKIIAVGWNLCASKVEVNSIMRYKSINNAMSFYWCHDGFAACIEILRSCYLKHGRCASGNWVRVAFKTEHRALQY